MRWLACFRPSEPAAEDPPAEDPPAPPAEDPPAPPAAAGLESRVAELGAMVEVLRSDVERVAGLYAGLSALFVSRQELADMAGVEEGDLGRLRLKTGGGWRFLTSTQDNDNPKRARTE